MDNNANVTLFHNDVEEWVGPFADFCASNKFEDGEIAEIEAGLDACGAYEGGGGALADFRLIVTGAHAR